ncbi:caspase-8-like [Salminus brasiliensis]|uniref:caspase-8-like n=1 Tax=Salminus brasiliensis TaxID=930266 RepID=UPI003B831F92
MQTIQEHKTILITILSHDAMTVLQYVDQAMLIAQREYKILKDEFSSHNSENVIINLLDILKNKGDNHCNKFLELFECEELQKTFPRLKELLIPPAARQAQETPKVSKYKMSRIPHSVCVIINNMHFDSSSMLVNRNGSDVDVDSLNEVFQWLGFTVEVYLDNTAKQMKALLSRLSQRQHKGDCFVCCILSHSSELGFYGTDGGTVDSSDILKAFGRANCPTLVDKPKVFILNTNRDQGAFAIPDSDFLLALSTLQGSNSYRHTQKGSWFIQSLCKMLKEGCKRGEDVLTVLTQVIAEVSAPTNPPVPFQQIPHVDHTLRKKLIFNVENRDHPEDNTMQPLWQYLFLIGVCVYLIWLCCKENFLLHF